MSLVKVFYSCPLCGQKSVPVEIRELKPTVRDFCLWRDVVVRKCFHAHGTINISRASEIKDICDANELDIKIPDEYKDYYLVQGSANLEKYSKNLFMENL